LLRCLCLDGHHIKTSVIHADHLVIQIN
jgi:hypothetical protein